MAMPSGAAMLRMQTWSAADLLALFVMWGAMMAAMMLPSALPMLVLFATVGRQRRMRASPAVPVVVFAAGYLVVWLAFSVGAALTQAALHRASLLSPAMVSATPAFSAMVLIAAGVYQWLPIKSICLGRCRSVLGFISTEWRDGHTGALVMGARHGVFCLGCCWALMALLFVGGVMNLLCIAAISALVLAEKAAPGGRWIARGAGAAFVIAGVWILLRPA
jgi:predicted metal-binding membrane protein